MVPKAGCMSESPGNLKYSDVGVLLGKADSVSLVNPMEPVWRSAVLRSLSDTVITDLLSALVFRLYISSL